MASNEEYTILYGRLSSEDTQKGSKDDSNSIQNQKLLLEKYAVENGFTNTKFIYDDGYSGTNFNRPGWKEVMRLIEAGCVKTLIVKDMSRLGREYLQVGQYTELIFPSYGVRFIAVNDGVDSQDESTNDFTPFRNIMNEFYAKDSSRKLRAIFKLKAESGARIGTREPFGYIKDPKDPKRKIVPDPDTMHIVKYIFQLCVWGKGPLQIANCLRKEQVPTPTAFYYYHHGVLPGRANMDDPCAWNQRTVANILENEVYLGHTVNMKTTNLSYKNKKRIDRPESEHIRFENTHEALIDQQTWDIVQAARKNKRRRANMEEQNIYSGLVYCADCGAKMTLFRRRSEGPQKDAFLCSTYRQKGSATCSVHTIRRSTLEAVVLDDLRRVTHFARQNETLFAEHIGKKNRAESQREMRRLRKEIDALSKRQGELMTLFKRLYEDNVLGRIPDEQYEVLSQGYAAEQKQLAEQLPKLNAQLVELEKDVSGAERFIDMAKKYTQINEITAEILWAFIERIEVGARAEKHRHYTPQEVRIYYRDIGLLDELPANEVKQFREKTEE